MERKEKQTCYSLSNLFILAEALVGNISIIVYFNSHNKGGPQH